MSLATDVKALVEAVNDIACLHLEDDDDVNLTCLAMMDEAARELSAARRRLGDTLGSVMGTRHRAVENVGTFERHARRDGSTKCIDDEGLWRYVIDTRYIDPESGEVVPTHEVIRMVYGAESKETGRVRLTGASPGKVEFLGVDPDDFFEKGDVVGWNVRLKS